MRAQDLGVLSLPIHQGKWSTSVLYQHSRVKNDFDTRGRADFSSNIAGAQVSFGVTDQIAVAIKGGVLVDPQQEAQGSRWESRAGYLFGFDLYNEIFPATEVHPGVLLSAGITGVQIPFDRLISGNGVTLVDQRLIGWDYHAAVVARWRLGPVTPYIGPRLYGRSLDWQDNRPSGGAASIHGTSKGNASLLVGLPFRLSETLVLQLEGSLISETVLTAGLTLASF